MAEIEEITDPLRGLSMDTVRDPNTNHFELLTNLLHRLPKDAKSELSPALLELIWHHVTSNNLEERLVPFRPEFHRQFPSKSNAISSSSSKSFSSTSIRNLDGNWRPKPTTSPEKLSSEPPPLPSYQKNIFQRHSNYSDTRKENSDKFNRDCNVSSIADFETNALTSSVIASTKEAPFSQQTVSEVNSRAKKTFDSQSNVNKQTTFDTTSKAVPYVESVELENVSPAHIRPATHGVFRIPEFDKIDLHEMANESEKSSVPPTLNLGSSRRRRPRRHQIASDAPYFDNLTPGIEDANAFDWAAETEGCRESFESQPAIRIARGEKPTAEQLAADQPDANVQIGKVKEESIRRQELTADYEKMKLQSTGSGAHRVAKVSSSYPSEPNVVSALLSHKIFCHVCSTSDHSTVDCPETPPAKLVRIRDLNLCQKCLSPAHLIADCDVANLQCTTCGMDHLDYIFHKPVGWMQHEYSKASSSSISTGSSVTVSTTGGGNSVPRSQQATLHEDMRDLLGQANSVFTQQPQKPSDNSSQLLIDFN